MMRLLALLASLILCGCETAGDAFRTTPGLFFDSNAMQGRQVRIDLERAIRASLPSTAFKTSDLNCASEDNANAECANSLEIWMNRLDRHARQYPTEGKTARNSIAGQLLLASEHDCSLYLQHLHRGQSYSRLISEVSSTALSVASSIATPESSSNILAAGSGVLSSAGGSVDRHVFADQAAEVIARQIRRERTDERAQLEQRLRDYSYAQYSLSEAISDIVAYHDTCSLVYALGKMEEQLIERETAIRASRQAAQLLADQQASGQQVLAVIQGIEGAVLHPSSLLPPGGSRSTTLNLIASESPDLNYYRDSVLRHLTEAQPDLSPTDTLTEDGLNTWRTAFQNALQLNEQAECSEGAVWIRCQFAMLALDAVPQSLGTPTVRSDEDIIGAVRSALSRRQQDLQLARGTQALLLAQFAEAAGPDEDMPARFNALAGPYSRDPLIAAMAATLSGLVPTGAEQADEVRSRANQIAAQTALEFAELYLTTFTPEQN
jgi:hypothetical protein